MRSDLQTRLLASVSRSFYLSLRFVPEAIRPGLSVGYLMARATDTVADTAQARGADRLRVLHCMGEVIAGQASSRAKLCETLVRDLSPNQEHAGEKELLSRFSEVLDMFDTLRPEEQAAVRKVLATIIRGQVLDLERFDCGGGADTVSGRQGLRCLPDEGALLEYTYLVAGCVGEFWTELGQICLDDAYWKDGALEEPQRKRLNDKARHYGQALQLVNILRDRSEDASRGRSYFPSMDSDREELDIEQKYIKQAREWLLEGILYTEEVRSVRLRFGTGLPALIGVRTLELLREHLEEKRVKVPRSEVYGLIWQACLASFRKGGWAGIAAKLRE